MNASTLICGTLVGVMAYKLGQMIQEMKANHEDENFGLIDLLDELQYLSLGEIYRHNKLTSRARRTARKFEKAFENAQQGE